MSLTPDADSPDFRSPPETRRYLADQDADTQAFEALLWDLRYTAICAWCLAPIRPSPAAPDPGDNAGKCWVSDGVRRYCDRPECRERGCIDGPPAGVTRSKRELFTHFENVLDALEAFYALEEHSFGLDVKAGEEMIRQACADRRSGEGSKVITEALAATVRCK